MPYIVEATTLQEIKDAAPETIWYSVQTCWWTHKVNRPAKTTQRAPVRPARWGVDDGRRPIILDLRRS